MDIDEIRRKNILQLQKVAGSAAAVAAKVGMSYVQYVNLRDGAKDPRSGKLRGMRKETAWRFENAFGMPRGWLDQPNEDELEAVRIGYISFDLLDVQAAAGDGSAALDFPEVVQRINVLESWAKTAIGGDLSRIKLISARGISMRGTIENGDVLFVDSTIRAYDGDGIYVIERDKDILVKRLEKLHGNRLAVISDNQQSRSEELDEWQANEVVICGRVLAAWSLKRFW